MRRFVLVLLTLLTGHCLADEQSGFDRTMHEVAADLSALHDELRALYVSKSPPFVYNFDLVTKYSLAGQGYIEITTPARLYKGADVTAGSFYSAAQGDKFRFLDKVTDWYAVALDKPIEGFSSGWVKAAQAVPVVESGALALVAGGTPSGSPPVQSDALYNRIVESVSSVREKYADNPYIAITGFSVDIGLAPAVSIQFAFK
ncbi:MAG: hypothetical protein OXK79_02310 [Chloroflexota bacterium]|nr:hypothetical protein [Chloroflexota bacterium]